MTSSSTTLNNGVVLPTVGLGVFQTPPQETTTAVTEALRVGYRLKDTAAAYGKEAHQAVRRRPTHRSPDHQPDR